MLEDDPSQSDLGDADAFGDALVEPDAETVDQPPGVASQLLIARAMARLGGEQAPAPVVVGRYRITRELGAGAMGLVFAGYDDALAREVAIKLLQGRLATNDESRQRLVREAQAMARLSHPNVAHVYEVGEHEGRVFIAMELVPGRTMRQWHREADRSVVEIVDMHLQAARGLAAAHEVELVHRDYKPDNVMIDDRGRARVMDFGLARHARDAPTSEIPRASQSGPAPSASGSGPVALSPLMVDATETGTVMGTPAYMAPEQMAGRRTDHRADQFAFCVALFEALHGHRPFAGTTTAAVLDSIAKGQFRGQSGNEGRRRRVPRGLEALVRRGLAFDPTARFPSMHTLAEELETFGSRGGMRGAWRRGRWWLVGAAAVGVASFGAAQLTSPAAATSTAQPSTHAAADEWATIVAASELPATVPEPLPDDPAHVTVHRLRNGLTVYLAPRAGVPTIDTVLVLRADPSDETPDEAGASSLLHAILGDSERIGSRDPALEGPLLAREHEALLALDRAEGDDARRQALVAADAARRARLPETIEDDLTWLQGELSLSTMGHELGPGTRWSQMVPRNRLTGWATLTAEGLRHPTFRRFLGATLAELEQRRSATEDALEVAIAREVGRQIGHPLDDVTVAESLHGFPFAATRDFWRTRCLPNNVAIVMVGEVSAAETLPALEAAFGDWEPAPLPPRHAPPPTIGGRVDLTDDGPTQVVRAWPRRDGLAPTDAIEVFLDQSSFAERWLAKDGRATWARGVSNPWIIQLAATPTAGHTLDDAEAALGDLLDVLADGPIDELAIASAQAQAELAAASSSSETFALSVLISESFARRTDWHSHLARARGEGMTRAAIAEGARALRDAGGVVVRRQLGEPAEPGLPATPVLPQRPASAPPPSAFAAQVAATPISQLEPQFLIHGHSFTEHARGNGRVIAVEHDVALVALQWIVPLGVFDEPWICDAWRAEAAALRKIAEPVGVAVRVTCGVRETTVHVDGVARRRDELWPILHAIAAPVLSHEDARAQLSAIVRGRAKIRDSSGLRADAFAVVALRGEHGIDAHLPDDAAVARSDGDELIAALVRSAATAPDVLVAGHDADRFARELVVKLPIDGALQGRTPALLRPRALDKTTVFALHDPGRTRADVRATIVVGDGEAATRVGLDAFFNVPSAALPSGSEAYFPYSWPRPMTFDGRLMFGMAAVECVPADVAVLAKGLVAALHTQPSVADLEQAIIDVTRDFRGARRLGMDAARDVWSWPKVSSERTDPALTEWATLTGIDANGLLALHARASALPVVVTVVADLDRVPVGTLDELGPVVRVELDALRDPAITDAQMFGFGVD